jgi:hypothetical protein
LFYKKVARIFYHSITRCGVLLHCKEMRRALVLGVATVTFVVVAGAWWAGDFLTKPARRSTGVPKPELHARPLTFDSVSGLKLSAWLFRGRQVQEPYCCSIRFVPTNEQCWLERSF